MSSPHTDHSSTYVYRFVQCLCKVFMEYSCEEDLVSLLARVTQQLKTYCTSRGEKQVTTARPSSPTSPPLPQVNETLLRGVSRRLYFNPGLVATPALSLGLDRREQSAMEVSTESLEVQDQEQDPLEGIWSGLATDSRLLCSKTG